MHITQVNTEEYRHACKVSLAYHISELCQKVVSLDSFVFFFNRCSHLFNNGPAQLKTCALLRFFFMLPKGNLTMDKWLVLPRVTDNNSHPLPISQIKCCHDYGNLKPLIYFCCFYPLIQIDRHTDRHRQSDSQTDRQTVRQIDRQTDHYILTL